MHVELLKALYGTLRAARLFWEKLSSLLVEWGFVINPYDTCIANKMINGKQCTVVWHVDDLKISHVDSKVVDHVVDLLDGKFGKQSPLYLGMELDFSSPGEVTIRMTDYIRGVLRDAPEDMKGKAVTPAAAHLFQVNTEAPTLLDEHKKVIFVHMVMQLLYVSQRERPDIRTAVAFLSGRLSSPDHDDYKKLARGVRYLRGNITLPLTLFADDKGLISWWVYASNAVHADMKRHTGGAMSLGKGCTQT